MLASGAAGADALNYFQNYFLTGDAAYGYPGMRGTGVNGFATANLRITAVPCTSGIGASASIAPCTTSGAVPVDVVAAYLYWETQETSPDASAMNGFFDGKPIVGRALGDANNPACWSSGGTTGSSIASSRVYRADVLGLQLRDSVLKGDGTIFLTNGATLVLVYRIQVPGKPHIAPLRSVVLYDGAYTMAKATPAFTQTIGGFYQAGNGSGNAAATVTPIVANGQAGFVETMTVTPNNGAAQTFTSPFTGSVAVRWDSATLPITPRRLPSARADRPPGSMRIDRLVGFVAA